MIFSIPSLDSIRRANKNNLEKWHDWFAWRPVRVNEENIVWLQKVRRRLQKSEYYPYYTRSVEYTLIQKETNK